MSYKKDIGSTSSTANILSTSDKTAHIDDVNEEDDVFTIKGDLLWGWRSFKPRCLQCFNSPKWFLFFLSCFVALQGIGVNAFVSLSLPTLEKRFELTSKHTGFIIAANDIPGVVLVVFVGFYGGYGHKTKWLGYGAIITGISGLLFALPKLLIGKYLPEELTSANSLCVVNGTSTSSTCSSDDQPFNHYFFIFVLAQVLAGAGTTPLFSLGPAYLDESVHPKSISTYLGVFYVAVLLGPGLGFMVGGQLLSLYVDIVMPDGLTMTTTDQRWVGAWWIGPCVSGFLLILNGIMLLGFPRKLPGSDAIRKEALEKGYIKKDKIAMKGTENFLPQLKSLLTNGTFMFQNFSYVFATVIGIGVGPFVFKLLTGRYGATPAEAGYGITMILVPSTALGILIGSLVVKKLGAKDSARRAAKAAFLLQLVGIWGSPVFIIPGCSYMQFAGTDVGYLNSSTAKLTDHCNTDCHCSESQFRPLCGPNGNNYFSSCFAGCKKRLENEGFTNCSCVDMLVNSTSMTRSHAILEEGSCHTHCPRGNLYGFIFGSFVVVLCGVLNAVPSKTVTLRSVSESQRSLGMGVQFLLLRLLSAIPAPVLVGAIIDATCTMWNTRCGVNQNCLNYDYNKLGFIIMFLGIPSNLMALLCYGLSWYCANEPESKTAEQFVIGNEDHHQDNDREKTGREPMTTSL